MLLSLRLTLPAEYLIEKYGNGRFTPTPEGILDNRYCKFSFRLNESLCICLAHVLITFSHPLRRGNIPATSRYATARGLHRFPGHRR